MKCLLQLVVLFAGVLRLTLVENTMRERVEQLEYGQQELRTKAKSLLRTGQREAVRSCCTHYRLIMTYTHLTESRNISQTAPARLACLFWTGEQ